MPFGRKRIRRSAFVTTKTELKLIANAPYMGSSTTPTANRTPAAIGMHSRL